MVACTQWQPGLQPNLEEACRGQAEAAEQEFIFKPKWALQLPGGADSSWGRIETGSWSDTCQECQAAAGRGPVARPGLCLKGHPVGGVREQQLTLWSPGRQWGLKA